MSQSILWEWSVDVFSVTGRDLCRWKNKMKYYNRISLPKGVKYVESSMDI